MLVKCGFTTLQQQQHYNNSNTTTTATATLTTPGIWCRQQQHVACTFIFLSKEREKIGLPADYSITKKTKCKSPMTTTIINKHFTFSPMFAWNHEQSARA